MRRAAFVATVAWACGLGPAPAQPARVDAATLDYRLQARALAPGVWVVEGANADFTPANGCNIINTGFIAGDGGVIVVNTGVSRRQGEQLRALLARTLPGRPPVQVLHLNLHPDYFLGNQGFADVPRAATAATRAGIAREAAAYESNLYRLCGDWMKGTETLAPDRDASPGVQRIAGRDVELIELAGHTDSDLVLIDRASGIAFVGGLVFEDRVPTTPHARIDTWLQSLDRLEALLAAGRIRQLVPSHGPVHAAGADGRRGLAQTRRYLQWLDGHLRAAAEQGLEITELLARPVPAEFRAWAAFDTEYLRNLTHLYPRYEDAALQRGR